MVLLNYLSSERSQGVTVPTTMGYWSVFVTVCVFVTPLVLAQDYRIPDTVVPSNYEIELFLPQTVFTGANTTFEGNILIKF